MLRDIAACLEALQGHERETVGAPVVIPLPPNPLDSRLRGNDGSVGLGSRTVVPAQVKTQRGGERPVRAEGHRSLS